MNVQEIADSADMIVAGFAYAIKEDYIQVVDLNDCKKRAVIQNDEVTESLMSDEEDEQVLKYYLRNKEILEESLNNA